MAVRARRTTDEETRALAAFLLEILDSPLKDSTPVKELNAQNDRGAAIVGGAILEELLQKLIVATWPPISNTVKDRIFSGFGPLSSFSAKIEVAHAAGFISNRVRLDLGLIRLLRNDAAHIGEPFSFEENLSRLKQISLYETYVRTHRGKLDSPKGFYLWANGYLAALLEGLAAVFKHDPSSFSFVMARTIAAHIEQTPSSSEEKRGS